MATKIAPNCAKYCVIGNLVIILQVIVADCFEKVPDIYTESRMKDKLIEYNFKSWF